MDRIGSYLLLLLFIGSAVQAALVPEQIGRFIDAHPTVRTWMQQEHVREKMVLDIRHTKPSDKDALFTKMLSNAGLEKEFLALVKPHGFDSVNDYMATATEVQRVYMALTSVEEQKGLLQKFKIQLEKIENSDLSPADKAALKEQLSGQLQRYQKLFYVTEEDKKTIKPYLNDLTKLFNE